ncbi:alpha-L-fucosidase [Verrucomicrobiota bacterium]
MKKHLFLVVLFFFCVGCVVANADKWGVRNVPVKELEEWNEWKFGLFIHWGPWAQTGQGGIWRGWPGWGKGKDKGPRPKEEVQKYLDMNKTFNPVKFDPAAWARVAKKAGMRYVVFTTKHHDGFCNFDTKLTDYRVTHPSCPYSKSKNPDITKHLFDEFRKQGFGIGVYYSHPDQHHPDGMWWKRHAEYIDDFQQSHPERWQNFVEFEKGQVRELLTNYGHIDIFWFDINWPPASRLYALPMLKMMRELAPNTIFDNRGTYEFADFETPEQKIPGAPPKGYWETCMTISNRGGFWYKGENITYKTSSEIIRKLCDIAAKGGNFLLNIGPRGDGTMPQGEIDTLLGVGEWMDVNGDAIYGTKRSPWGVPPEWGYITKKGLCLYLIVFKPETENAGENRTISLALNKNKIKSASLLTDGSKIKFRGTGKDVVQFALPEGFPGKDGSVIVVDLNEEPDVKQVWDKKDQVDKKAHQDVEVWKQEKN